METKTDGQSLGTLMQAYARARWGDRPDKESAGRLAAQLGQELRDRIDMLGFDAECLLEVSEDNVLAELQALERQAALEDAGAERTADRVRAREEMQISDPAKASRRSSRVPQGKHRAAAQHGGGGQRGKR